MIFSPIAWNGSREGQRLLVKVHSIPDSATTIESGFADGHEAMRSNFAIEKSSYGKVFRGCDSTAPRYDGFAARFRCKLAFEVLRTSDGKLAVAQLSWAAIVSI